jgi:L-asparaginase II
MLRLGLVVSDEQLALACASHDGTPTHVEVVRSILADAGLDPTALGNTADWPLDPEEAEALIAAGEHRAPIYMNCSGKHAAMVATCVVNGWPIETYLEPDHPMQTAITDHVAALAGAVAHIGVDGCGAPAHAMSLRGLADAVRTVAAAEGQVWRAMSGHPALVGGTRRVSAKLVAQAPGFLAKEGAEGMFVAARPGGPSVAVKVADGGGRAAGVVAVTALRAVGVDVDPDPIAPPILGHGQPVGAVRALLPEA